MLGTKEYSVVYPMPEAIIDVLTSAITDKESGLAKSGITILGSCIGGGKTSTIHSLIDHIEKTDIIQKRTLAYINAKELDYRHIDAAQEINELTARLEPHEMVVIIDALEDLEGLKAAIDLAKKGCSVIFTITTVRGASLSEALDTSFEGISGYEQKVVAGELLRHINLLVVQKSHCPVSYEFLEFPNTMNPEFTEELNQKGLDYVFKELINSSTAIKKHSLAA